MKQYTWQQYEQDIKKLVRRISPRLDINFDNIYGVPRNGLVIAIHLSHIFEVPLILQSIDITSRTLVVDDIVDTGKTLLNLKSECWKRYRIRPFFVTLFYKSTSKFKPDLFINQTAHWIQFPWETKRSSKYDRGQKTT